MKESLWFLLWKGESRRGRTNRGGEGDDAGGLFGRDEVLVRNFGSE